jgi:hypothetical protein
MKNRAKFKSYKPEKLFLAPPDMKDWLPDDLRFAQSRLKKVEEAKKALEEESRAEAAAKQAEHEVKKKAYDKKSGRKGRPPWRSVGRTGSS